MKTTKEDLIRMEWIKLEMFGYYEIWALYDERLIYDPKNQEVVMKYNIKDEKQKGGYFGTPKK